HISAVPVSQVFGYPTGTIDHSRKGKILAVLQGHVCIGILHPIDHLSFAHIGYNGTGKVITVTHQKLQIGETFSPGNPDGSHIAGVLYLPHSSETVIYAGNA